jgi:hypothetical protein
MKTNARRSTSLHYANSTFVKKVGDFIDLLGVHEPDYYKLTA